VELAATLACRSLAFPAISTGVYGYPPELAAPVAVGATKQALARWPLGVVRFVL
jgi:O-acetyl-ADP-ribose deacetylase